MNINEFINNNILILPKSRMNSDEPFDLFVQNVLKEYLTSISDLDSDLHIFRDKYTKDELIGHVALLNDAIVQTINLYLKGKKEDANIYLSKTLNHISIDDKIELAIATSGRYYYRLRNNIPCNEAKDRKALLHVPFSKIKCASHSRYSIEGKPALYLGSNTFTCFKELDLDQKKPENCYLSKVEFESTAIRLFDLRIRLNEVKDKIRDNPDGFYAYLMMFPLVFACSIRRCKNDKDKHEYIIPQIIMKWVSERNDVNYFGIAYSSSKIEDKDISERSLFYNVVIPSRSISENQQYCAEMMKQVKLTMPIEWCNNKINSKKTLLNYYSDFEYSPIHKHLAVKICGKINYWNTYFALNELLVESEELKKI